VAACFKDYRDPIEKAEGSYDPTLKNVGFKQGREEFLAQRVSQQILFFVKNKSVGFDPSWARQGRRHSILV